MTGLGTGGSGSSSQRNAVIADGRVTFVMTVKWLEDESPAGRLAVGPINQEFLKGSPRGNFLQEVAPRDGSWELFDIGWMRSRNSLGFGAAPPMRLRRITYFNAKWYQIFVFT
jgi:hypothetical protein